MISSRKPPYCGVFFNKLASKSHRVRLDWRPQIYNFWNCGPFVFFDTGKAGVLLELKKGLELIWRSPGAKLFLFNLLYKQLNKNQTMVFYF